MVGAAQLQASYKSVYSDSQAQEMDKKYADAAGQDSASFDMDKLGEGADAAGGWTMNDEYDPPQEEYGDDRADADKVPAPSCGLCMARPCAATPVAPSPASRMQLARKNI